MLGQIIQLPASQGRASPELPHVDGESNVPPGAGAGAALQTARGACRPLGATLQHGGVNFAVFSRHAHSVHLVLFEEGREEPFAEIALDPSLNRTGDIWHIQVKDLPAGMLYGYRVNGPYSPRQGHRFSPRTILLDPYARQVSGGYPWGVRQEMRNRPARLGMVVNDPFDWEGDVAPRTPLAKTIIYEMHVRGFTRHPSSGVQNPGTYLGMLEKIPYLEALGVTAVQLMPVMEFDEFDGHRRNPYNGQTLLNYWGYSPLSYLALKGGYSSRQGQQNREFKELIKGLHRAGIEVILDVVYNHTCEGNENGPTVSFRGLDSSIYYMLDKEGRNYNYSGCGNTLNCPHPVVQELILDSLIEMVAEYHIDGFRFDLAAVLARGPGGKVLEEPPLLHRIAEHPALAGVKLIAEAWDAAGLSLVGKFHGWGRWLEFNGHFRDDVRRFVRSEAGATEAVAKRISGSMDLYGSAKHAYHSINYVTCHDGFTLWDLVSYSKKQNWANGEENRDGWDDNLTFNCGHEGPSDNWHIAGLRQRQVRNFLTVMMLSQGVPFLLMGDEMGRSQQGNNNAYCQDNEISWLDWGLTQRHGGLVRFTSMLIALRKKYFALSREEFLERSQWHGTKLYEPDWTGMSRTLALQLRATPGHPGFYVLLNFHWEPQRFQLPSRDGQGRWKRLLDTNLPTPDDIVEEHNAVRLHPDDYYLASPRSVVILLQCQ